MYCRLLCVYRLKNVNCSILRKAIRLSRHTILCRDIIFLCCDIGSLCDYKEWISLFEVAGKYVATNFFYVATLFKLR